MKFLALILLAITAGVSTRHISLEDVIEFEKNSAYGYHSKIGIPLADKVRKAEEEGHQDMTRIVGGSLAALGQFPYQAGLLLALPLGRASLAGGVLISPSRVLTAAHNLNDAIVSVTQITVVLGSINIFTGGTRLFTSDFVLHENWNAAMIRNDIAIINLPAILGTSSTIAPVALPSGSQLDEDFAGFMAIASGYGKTTSIGTPINESLRFAFLPVITNAHCAESYPMNIQPSNLCTSGWGGMSICTGDSGGPLVIYRNNGPLLIGITSFHSNRGCESGDPAAYARVSYYMDWINKRL